MIRYLGNGGRCSHPAIGETNVYNEGSAMIYRFENVFVSVLEVRLTEKTWDYVVHHRRTLKLRALQGFSANRSKLQTCLQRHSRQTNENLLTLKCWELTFPVRVLRFFSGLQVRVLRQVFEIGRKLHPSEAGCLRIKWLLHVHLSKPMQIRKESKF